MRVSDSQCLIETPVHMLAHGNGLPGPPREQEKKVCPCRVRCRGPVGKTRVTLLRTVAGCARTSRQDLTIRAYQLQGVRGADTVRSLAQHWLALRIATDGYIGVRIAIRYEFVAKQPILDNRQQVQHQPSRQRIAESSSNEVASKQRQQMLGLRERRTEGSGHGKLPIDG